MKPKHIMFLRNSITFIFLLQLTHVCISDAAKVSEEKTPRLIGEALQNFTVRVGNDIIYGCSVKDLGSYRVAWLHSLKGTLAVHPHVITHNNRISVSHDNTDTYFLQLKNVKESDAGSYICQINTGPPISIRGSLHVVVPPDILDEESSSEILATEGTRVELHCKARGNPTPVISWKREDKRNISLCQDRLSSAQQSSLNWHQKCEEVELYKGSPLILPEVRRFDSGDYFCLASNGVLPIVSKRVKVHVEFPPNMWISHQLIGVEVGGSALLECLTAANPTSLNFWIKESFTGSDFITSNGRHVVQQIEGVPSYYSIQMKMRIHNVTHSDFGNYTCLAKNPLGETSGKIVLYEIQSTTKVPTTTLFKPDEGEDSFNKYEDEPVDFIKNLGIPDIQKSGENSQRKNEHFGRKRNDANSGYNNFQSSKDLILYSSSSSSIAHLGVWSLFLITSMSIHLTGLG